MTTENRLLDVSYEAAEDLSNDQYEFAAGLLHDHFHKLLKS